MSLRDLRAQPSTVALAEDRRRRSPVVSRAPKAATVTAGERCRFVDKKSYFGTTEDDSDWARASWHTYREPCAEPAQELGFCARHLHVSRHWRAGKGLLTAAETSARDEVAELRAEAQRRPGRRNL